MTTVAIIVALLLVANGLFVAAEFAIVGAPRPAVDRMAAEGSKAAERVSRILRDPLRQDRYIATAQLGITVASLGLGMYGEVKLASWLAAVGAGSDGFGWLASHAVASTVSIAGLTYLHIVLGEMVPKAVSLAQPQRVALWITPIMLAIQTVMYPFVAGLNGLGNMILRAMGIERRFGGGAHYYTAEELQHIVAESEQGGLIGHEEAQVFERLVEFGDLLAREAMVPRVRIRGIEIGAGREELLEVLTSEPHTRYPVYAHDLDHIVGMIRIKDIAHALAAGRGIQQRQVRRVPFVPGSATLDTVLAAMRDAGVQMAVVMDEHGGTDGIITNEDLFEEIVGEIDDDGAPHAPIAEHDDGSLRVAGTVRVEELGEHVDIDLEHEEVDTVSGLVLALLDRPPRIGDRVHYQGFELEVTGVSGHGVTECRVVPPQPRDEDE